MAVKTNLDTDGTEQVGQSVRKQEWKQHLYFTIWNMCAHVFMETRKSLGFYPVFPENGCFTAFSSSDERKVTPRFPWCHSMFPWWLLEFHCVPVCGGASVDLPALISLSLSLSRTHTLLVLWCRPWLFICLVILFLGFKNAFFQQWTPPLVLGRHSWHLPGTCILHQHTLQILMLNLMEHLIWVY